MTILSLEKLFVLWISFPGIGEIVGGSQREEVLMFSRKMKALGIDEEELWWYLDTRRFDQQFIQVLD
jgi:aspartyl/asparaginyl-tRNA synthetase